MSNVYNLQKYKRAKTIVKELQIVLPILKSSYTALKPYIKYRAVMECINTIHDAEIILETHLRNEKKVISNNGLEE